MFAQYFVSFHIPSCVSGRSVMVEIIDLTGDDVNPPIPQVPLRNDLAGTAQIRHVAQGHGRIPVNSRQRNQDRKRFQQRERRKLRRIAAAVSRIPDIPPDDCYCCLEQCTYKTVPRGWDFPMCRHWLCEDCYVETLEVVSPSLLPVLCYLINVLLVRGLDRSRETVLVYLLLLARYLVPGW